MCWQGCSPCTSPQWTVFCLLQCSLYTVFALFIAHCWAKHTPLQCQCVDRGCTPCTLWISASLEIERDFVVAWNFLLLKKIEVNWKYLLASLEIEPDFVVGLENDTSSSLLFFAQEGKLLWIHDSWNVAFPVVHNRSSKSPKSALHEIELRLKYQDREAIP